MVNNAGSKLESWLKRPFMRTATALRLTLIVINTMITAYRYRLAVSSVMALNSIITTQTLAMPNRNPQSLMYRARKVTVASMLRRIAHKGKHA